jgi:hypothetical protein
MPVIAIVAAAIELAEAIVGHIPEPDLEIRRAKLIGRMSSRVATLEAHGHLKPHQAGDLAKAKAILEQLHAAVPA